jgi:DNA segregation ATPase FtsK/SpoIIIE, S-DNA-T family
MKQKILKIQLVSLFAVAFLNLIYFYFKERLPDNFYEISSINTGINAASYYVISLLAHIGFYSGIWVFAGFVAFAVVYSFLLTKKNAKSEAPLAILPVTGMMLLCYVLFPETIGEGLATFMRQNSTAFGLFIAIVSHGLAMYYLIAPASFKKNAKRIGKTCMRMAARVRQGDWKIPEWNPEAIRDWSKAQVSILREKLQFRKIVPAIKIDSYRNTSPAAMPAPAAPVAPMARPIVETPVAEVEEEEVESEEDEEIEFEDDTTDEAVTEDEESEESEEDEEVVSKASPFVKVTTPFFAAEDLIDCVSTTHRVRVQDPDSGYFSHIGGIIEDKLKEFGINSQVVGVMKGPVVDTFELNLGAGVKVSSVSNRADDVSLALSGAPIRMVYPMKGKTTVGVEVPRNPRDFIYLDEVLKTTEFRESVHGLPIAMGKDAYGRPSVVDLTSMPHMLVAGTTGSGKSVFINTLLVSLIVRNSPERLKLILIDPKSVELALFQTLPHLIMPTVTDAGMASVALLWAVEEMERRYALLRELGVRNIEGYNRKVADADSATLARVKPHFEDDSETFNLPFLVIVVDEVADLIQSKHGKEIETNVSRLAAKARAAGIHLILATQRPSTDVITGVIKANFPTRIAFKVITNMDSRVILDTQGAEKLLGKGDMLFKQGVDLLRVHSAYVDEAEIEKLVAKLDAIPVQYSQAALDFIETAKMAEVTADNSAADGDDQPEDPLFREAVDVVARTRQASASWLQRRMNVGYNRAAKLVEAMERKGIVGPGNGSKPRQVLVPPPDDVTG